MCFRIVYVFGQRDPIGSHPHENPTSGRIQGIPPRLVNYRDIMILSSMYAQLDVQVFFRYTNPKDIHLVKTSLDGT